MPSFAWAQRACSGAIIATPGYKSALRWPTIQSVLDQALTTRQDSRKQPTHWPVNLAFQLKSVSALAACLSLAVLAATAEPGSVGDPPVRKPAHSLRTEGKAYREQTSVRLAQAKSSPTAPPPTHQPYSEMDYGSFLTLSLEVTTNNIAYKGIAIRLDEGDGGVAEGRAFVVFDTDLMRYAAGWTGR